MEWTGIFSIAIIILSCLLLILNREQKKLKSKVEGHDEFIKDLYRIENERLLHQKRN